MKRLSYTIFKLPILAVVFLFCAVSFVIAKMISVCF